MNTKEKKISGIIRGAEQINLPVNPAETLIFLFLKKISGKLKTSESLIVFIVMSVLFSGVSNADMANDDSTMLMFVGQNLSVVTIASRTPESSGGAPALVRVVNNEEITMRGFDTLGELLAFEPGIYISEKASGSVAYMRGVKNGLLFLYNGVPLSTNAIRNAGHVDKEISLHNIARVEIIRGPGSVFWGADAFAGIVNIVPFTALQKKGGDSQLKVGEDRSNSLNSSLGGMKNDWKFYFSGYLGEDLYHKESYAVETSTSQTDQSFSTIPQNTIDGSRYSEFTGSLSKGNWLDLSWRFAQSNREYVVNDTEDLTWRGGGEIESNYLKATIFKKIKMTEITFSSYYQYYKELTENVDLDRILSDRIFYTEMIMHQPIALDDHLTAGVSYRASSIKGAVLEDEYLPQSLKPSNEIFIPTADQEDFFNDFISVFVQYRHKWGRSDTWIGARYDDNEGYNSTTSYNLGINIPVGLLWRVKFVGGTAYRTPYANYFIQNGSFDPERITTLNLEAIWSNPWGATISFALFRNSLQDCIYEDPYGGLSQPTDQTIIGSELTGETQLLQNLKIYGSFTAMKTKGNSIPYQLLLYTYVSPNGNSTSGYDEWESSYDAGPEFMISGGFFWEPCQRIFLSAKAIFMDNIPFSFEKNTKTGFFHTDPTVSVEAGVKNMFIKNSRLTLGCKNLFNVSNQAQGTYGPVETTPSLIYLKYKVAF